MGPLQTAAPLSGVVDAVAVVALKAAAAHQVLHLHLVQVLQTGSVGAALHAVPVLSLGGAAPNKVLQTVHVPTAVDPATEKKTHKKTSH